MLEKIGLPAKPSMRGSNWVVDASHCQGCSSQFTFINRKHHCRRCGGLFCNSCTNQRMYLRGQGDSPVRICDPCKKLEEAARFEMRHGNKSRTSRGSSKLTVKDEDEVLNQILGTDVRQSSLSGSVATKSNVFSDMEKGTSNASSSNFREEAVLPSFDTQNDTEEIDSYSPEKLLQMSLEEKKKYRTLKGEGKPEEALRAFKRGKELERQAKALEVATKKNNRKASSSNKLVGKTTVDSEGSFTNSKVSSHIDKESKNDLASELRELGWSEADLHDADAKPVKTSLEGELSTLLGEVHKKSDIGKRTGSIDKTQVLAIKRKALSYKREGKLVEAKEELKKAKVLEKQLEEQEFLAEAEDSDDELSALIRSMDSDEQNDFMLNKQDVDFDFNHLVGASEDLGLDGNFEVTEEDMEDPEIAAALESIGWAEESDHPVVPTAHFAFVDGKVLSDDVLALKKEAVRQKRSGNVEEAMALLRRAKLLEKDTKSMESQGSNFVMPNLAIDDVLTSDTTGDTLSMKVDNGMVATSTYVEPKLPPKSKLMIQRELLALKKRALVLRREGRLDEAEEELRKGKVLESQLEEMETGSKVSATKPGASSKVTDLVHKQPGLTGDLGPGEHDDEADVTEQDMEDPTMLKMLENLGWKDEESQPEPSSKKVVMAPKRSKAEIQRELLGLKRKALTLRRQGQTDEAEEVLKNANLLEAQLEEIDLSKNESTFIFVKEPKEPFEQSAKLSDHDADPPKIHVPAENPSSISISTPTNRNPLLDFDPPAETKVAELAGSFAQSSQSVNLVDLLTGGEWQSSLKPVEEVESKGSFSTDIFSLNNVQSGSSKSSNKVKESEDEFFSQNKGKSVNRVEKAPDNVTDSTPASDSQISPTDLPHIILARKRKAVALKREGKLAEAREELYQAKLLEKNLQEDKPQTDAGSTDISISNSNAIPIAQEEHKVPHEAPKPMAGRDRFKLQQQSLAHKRQALKLRREGRIAEAEAEFELAKALETQLEESSGHDSKSTKETERMDDLGVEDLLDPQLLSALKAIGLQDAEVVQHARVQPESAKPNFSESGTSNQERSQLEERIKAEKVKAMNLKKAGKQAEALDALRRAKMYEKKLNTLS
ncbi:Vacuolar protein sorting-associated protein [Thalictrum thalictroides]|uniref:Vacuolar protein sorting-associated protein n=1 Tax=Thalictrum thalictroides TaxID=46969 RepID=A0A7J6XDZ0_THATH|nr:Vacuolar protein sorting-associated protein [Thalictrum thalictroides]